MLLSPISQLNVLNPYRDESVKWNHDKFNTIYSELDFFEKILDKPNFLFLKARLTPGDILYIPSYYFKQFKILSEKERYLKYTFESNNRVLDTMLKVLYDDSISEDLKEN